MVTSEPNLTKEFPERNARKFIVSFAFCPHVDVIKIEKHLCFPLSAPILLELSSHSRMQW